MPGPRQLEALIQDPAFRRWFGDSKIVDERGLPRTMYHGTVVPHDFDRFRRRLGDIGIHFGDAGQANDRIAYRSSRQQRPDDANRLLPVFLRAENPLRLPHDPGLFNMDNLPSALDTLGLSVPSYNSAHAKRWYDTATLPMGWEGWGKRQSGTTNGQLAAIRDAIQQKGYDSLIYKNTGETGAAAHLHSRLRKLQDMMLNEFGTDDVNHPDVVDSYLASIHEKVAQKARDLREKNAADSYAVFDPRQIKSIFNRGTWDPKDPRINYAGGGYARMPRVPRSMRLKPGPMQLADGGWISNVLRNRAVRNSEKQRLTQAADLVPGLERQFDWPALQPWIMGHDTNVDTSRLVPIDPADFERAALSLRGNKRRGFNIYDIPSEPGIGPIRSRRAAIEALKTRIGNGGFDELPHLELDVVDDIMRRGDIFEVTQHEGRHRSRALSQSGINRSLIGIYGSPQWAPPHGVPDLKSIIRPERSSHDSYRNVGRPDFPAAEFFKSEPFASGGLAQYNRCRCG